MQLLLHVGVYIAEQTLAVGCREAGVHLRLNQRHLALLNIRNSDALKLNVKKQTVEKVYGLPETLQRSRE